MPNDLIGGYVVVYPPKKKFPLVKNQNFSPRNFPPNSFLKKIHFPKGHAYKFLKFVPNLQKLFIVADVPSALPCNLFGVSDQNF